MKKTALSIAALAAVTVLFAKGKPGEEVLMTVGDRPVYNSEFEYLYKKNAGQQLEPMTIDEYVEKFTDYKLKVASALDERMDTTGEYRKELEQFKVDLARPYMRDTALEQQLLDEAYDHYKRQRNVSHLMVQLGQTPRDLQQAEALIDSLRAGLEAGTLQWDSVVAANSIDRGTSQRGGLMGWLPAGRFPWPFEKAAYDTPVGSVSQPVNSGYGLHLIRVNDERPNPGEVKVRHILKLTQRKSPEEAARAKEQIDSLYLVLTTPGADFAEIATRESEDPGSARNGGSLDWFGPGAMVAEFDSAAFAMTDGEISRPIRTGYGWHIIEKLDSRPTKDRREMQEQLQATINNDERGMEPERSRLEQLKARYGSRLLDDNIQRLRDMIAANAGGFDSTMKARLATDNTPVVQVGKKTWPVSDIMPALPVTAATDPDNARNLIASAAVRFMEKQTLDMERDNLAQTNPDYRNLINEYSDGILFFDISKVNVWDRAAQDRQGIDEYFAAHKDGYTFDEPRYKAFIIFCANDSVELAAREYTRTLDPQQINPLTFAQDMRQRFGRDIKVERVIAKKGENAITDHLAFGGPAPDPKTLNWHHYYAFRDRIIDNPQEADDIRGQVIADYQNHLEREWVKELRKKYRVKVNQKVLDKVKKELAR